MEVTKMSIPVKVLAVISLSAFTIAALVGFEIPEDTNNIFSKCAVCIKNKLKWQWLEKRYSLSRIVVMGGLIFGIVSIALS